MILKILFFIFISFLVFNFTIPQKETVESCVSNNFIKSDLPYEEYCHNVGGFLLDGICNLYSATDSEVKECFTK